MLLVIFGAGASYDSVPALPPQQPHPYRPPLANELFADRELFAEAIRRFPRCQAVIPWLRQLPPGVTVESRLESFRAQADKYPERHKQLAAVRYYLHLMLTECERHWKDAAKGVTNYKSLLDQIEQHRKAEEPVCLVTFNYDSLLEEALPDVGLRIRDLSDYVGSHRHYRVIKLHGSVNWAREVETAIQSAGSGHVWTVAEELIERAAELRISQRYVMTGVYPAALHEGKVVFPAIAIPVETKSEFECPPEHLEILRKLLPQVRKLLLIGWRGTEDHFLTLLRTYLQVGPEIMVVAGSEKGAREVMGGLKSKLQAAQIGPTFHITRGGFTELVVNREADAFLSK